MVELKSVYYIVVLHGEGGTADSSEEEDEMLEGRRMIKVSDPTTVTALQMYSMSTGLYKRFQLAGRGS